LVQVKGGGGAKKYREESEVFRCKGGNQQLAKALAKELGDRVFLELAVTEIAQNDKGVTITCRDGREIQCDDVVLAVPPSVWSKIKFSPELPAMLTPQTGVDVKYFAPMKKRIWDQKDPAHKEKWFSQYGTSDGDVCMTWEGTDKQEGDGEYCLV